MIEFQVGLKNGWKSNGNQRNQEEFSQRKLFMIDPQVGLPQIRLTKYLYWILRQTTFVFVKWHPSAYFDQLWTPYWGKIARAKVCFSPHHLSLVWTVTVHIIKDSKCICWELNIFMRIGKTQKNRNFCSTFALHYSMINRNDTLQLIRFVIGLNAEILEVFWIEMNIKKWLLRRNLKLLKYLTFSSMQCFKNAVN